MVGRWRSGAPLVLSPEHDDPTLGADPNRNNSFTYSDDMEGLKCPFSAHIRRINPRDALKEDLVAVNHHHILRRGTNYGPPLPEGALEDDGEQRGGVFVLVGAHIKRQFEFLQSRQRFCSLITKSYRSSNMQYCSLLLIIVFDAAK